MSHSQNNEEEFIADYFKGFKGVLLDIGANNGIRFSNVYKLLSDGWKGTLVEPAKESFSQLRDLWKYRDDIQCLKVAVGTENGEAILHVNTGNTFGSSGLLSTLKESEMPKWKSVTYFEDETVEVLTYENLLKESKYKIFDMISIDCEGLDWDVLKQIDLTNVKLLVIEWNSIPDLKERFTDYCIGFMVIGINAENIIFAR